MEMHSFKKRRIMGMAFLFLIAFACSDNDKLPTEKKSFQGTNEFANRELSPQEQKELIEGIEKMLRKEEEGKLTKENFEPGELSQEQKELLEFSEDWNRTIFSLTADFPLCTKDALEQGGLTFEPENSPNLVFGTGDEEVGKLTWEDGKLNFEGNASESAQIFFDVFLKNLVDEYIEKRLKEGEKEKKTE